MLVSLPLYFHISIFSYFFYFFVLIFSYSFLTSSLLPLSIFCLSSDYFCITSVLYSQYHFLVCIVLSSLSSHVPLLPPPPPQITFPLLNSHSYSPPTQKLFLCLLSRFSSSHLSPSHYLPRFSFSISFPPSIILPPTSSSYTLCPHKLIYCLASRYFEDEAGGKIINVGDCGKGLVAMLVFCGYLYLTQERIFPLFY